MIIVLGQLLLRYDTVDHSFAYSRISDPFFTLIQSPMKRWFIRLLLAARHISA